VVSRHGTGNGLGVSITLSGMHTIATLGDVVPLPK
jgi:hypothetical protein